MTAIVLGKLPSHGDFIARGATAAEREAIDTWLSGSMAIARQELGHRFDQAFDRAPPWQFAFREGDSTAGALAASVDSAGRRFPLFVARTGLQEDQVGSAAKLCEAAAADAILNHRTADELVKAVDGFEITNGPPCATGWWTEQLGDTDRLNGRFPDNIVTRMLAPVAAQ